MSSTILTLLLVLALFAVAYVACELFLRRKDRGGPDDFCGN